MTDNVQEIETFKEEIDKNDVENFDVYPPTAEFLTSIKNMNKDEFVEVLMLMSVAPNIYILNVLSALSKFLRDLFEENKEISIKIKFLLLGKIIEVKAPYIYDSFIKHNKQIIPKIGEDEEKLASSIKIASSSISSTVNMVLSKLEGHEKKMDDIICNHMSFIDIDEYYEEDGIDNVKIENIVGEIKKPQRWDQTGVGELFFNKKYNVFEKIIKSIIHSKNSTQANKIIIIDSEFLMSCIRQFFEKYDDDELKNKLEIISFTEPPVIDKPPFYLSILSAYFNEGKSINDEYYFSRTLKTLNRESLFPYENLRELHENTIQKYRYEKSGKFENRDKMSQVLSEQLEKLQKEQGNNKEVYLGQIKKESVEPLKRYIFYYKPKMQKIVMKNIDEGFIAVQKSIISQLEFIM